MLSNKESRENDGNKSKLLAKISEANEIEDEESS